MTPTDLTDFIKNNEILSLETALIGNPSLADGHTGQGVSYLLLAAYYRNNAAVDLIKKHKSKLDLFEASATGELERVRNLISGSPELVNSFSPDGFTALGLSCFFGHPDIAQYLISAGADVNIPSNNSFKVAPLHSAVAISHFHLTQLLLDNGADVNARQNSGVTALHSAAHNGQLELVKLLVVRGAEPNAKMENGQTPLAMAEEKGAADVAAFLRKHGAN